MDFKLKDYSYPLAILKHRSAMKKTPYYPKEKMEQITFSRLKDMCIYANAHVPYYQKLFSSIGLDPAQMTTYEEFQKIPVMNKDTVREHYAELQSDELSHLGAVSCETSGSTGTPLKFYLDSANNSAAFALFWRMWETGHAWNIFKRQVLISGNTNGMWTYNRMTHILWVSVFQMRDDSIEKIYRAVEKYHPAVLRGYPSAIYTFGKLLEKKGLSLHFKIIFTGSESLLDFQREFIEKFFHAKIINMYTMWERVGAIVECEEGHLHAQNDFGYHEILNDQGLPAAVGEMGHIVCTGLYNKAMPLIRYDTRDLGQWSAETSCKCGSQFPIVDTIYGRISDMIVTPDGRYVGLVDTAFYFCKNVKTACIYQPDRSKIIVKIVPTEDYSLEEDERPLLKALRERLGNEIGIELKKVNESEIPKTPAGKVRFVISDVPKEEKLGHM